MDNNSNLFAVNIPADGLFLAILSKANGDFSEDNCRRIITSYIDRYLDADPDIILLNVCYRRSLTPSKVIDSYLYDIEIGADGETLKTISPVTDGVSKYFSSFFSCARVLLQNGVDIFKILTEYLRPNKCKVYFSVRMNDGHYINNPAINSSFALKDGGKHTIDGDGASLDFSQKEVQDYFFRYIKELIENYDIDGIELDWLRYPTVLPLEKRADLQILNDYMLSVCDLINGYNNKLGLAVRVLAHEQDNLNNGLDVCRWIADGIIDTVTIENFYIPTNYEMPVADWRAKIAEKNTAENGYRLLCGSDWGVSCVRGYNIAMNPDLVRGFKAESLCNGADGVYLFNYFEEDDTSSYELVSEDNGTAYLKNCFSERLNAVRDPSLLPRRYVHIGESNDRYPIALSSKECYEFLYRFRKPFNICEIVVGCSDDVCISASLNGNADQILLQNNPVYDGFEYIPDTEIGKKSEFIYAVSQTSPFVKSAVLPIKEDGLAKITLKNNGSQSVNLLWIELYFK